MNRAFLPVLIAGLLLLLSVGGYFVWHGQVESRAAEAAQLQSELRAKTAAGGDPTARRALEELSKNEAAVRSRFVSEADIVPYLEGLEATGERLGSTVEVVSVGNTPAKGTEPGSVQVSLRIDGTFDADMRTLGAIEYQSYDTRLVSLAFDSPEGTSTWTAAAVFHVGTGPAQ